MSEPSSIWQSRRLAYAVLILAAALRLALLSWPAFYTGIETLHVPSSITYVQTGHFDPDNDYSGPFRKIMQYPTLRLLGDTAVARRLPNAVFGSLTAFFLVLLGQQLFPGRRVGGLAGLFLATDPFHVSFSRTTWEDIPVALFITAGLYFLAKALAETRPDRYITALVWSGSALALALATRRYVAVILIAVVAWLIYREFKGPESIRGSSFRRRLLFFVVIFGLLPLVAYMLTFYPWLTRGYSLSEWLSFQKHMINEELMISPQLSEFAKFYGQSYRAFDWFTRPVIFGYQMRVNRFSTATVMIINNPFSWLLIWPAVATLMYFWRRTQQANLALMVAGLMLLYVPFLIARRQILVYSALAVLPLAFLLLATALELAQSQAKKTLRFFSVSLVIVILAVNLALYPLAVAMPLPNSWSKFVPFSGKIMKAGPAVNQ